MVVGVVAQTGHETPKPQNPRLVYPIVDKGNTSGFEKFCAGIFCKKQRAQKHDTSLQTFGYN